MIHHQEAKQIKGEHYTAMVQLLNLKDPIKGDKSDPKPSP
jgi:hypothetical protein